MRPTAAPSSRPSSAVPTKSGDTNSPSTAAPTPNVISYIRVSEAELNDDTVAAKLSAFGKIVMYGQEFNADSLFSAVVDFADNCGVIKSRTLVNTEGSYSEQFSGYVDLPGGGMQLVGDTLVEGSSVGLMSEFSREGVYSGSYGMKFDLPVAFTAATPAGGSRIAYLGYSGEGYDFRDIMIMIVDRSGASGRGSVVSSMRYGSGGEGKDEATAAINTAAGLVVVGSHRAGEDAFVMLLDGGGGGGVVFSHSLTHTVLRNTAPASKVGYVAAGEVALGACTLGLLLVGAANGTVARAVAFNLSAAALPQTHTQGAVKGYAVTELRNGNFAVVMDTYAYDASGAEEVAVIIAEVNIAAATAATVVSARYVGELGDTKTYGRSIFSSPHGGYVLVGSSKRRVGTHKRFIGELTEDLVFPGHAANEALPPGTLTCLDVLAEISAGEAGFVAAELTGRRSVGVGVTITTSTPSQTSVSYGQGDCVAVAVSPAPSALPTARPSSKPSTSKPSTAAPSTAPSVRPSARPSTATPTAAPSTAKPTLPGDTEEPTAVPTVAPTAGPTETPSLAPTSEVPTGTPSAAPSTARPSTRAPTPSPSGQPSTAAPTPVIPSARPSPTPTAAPTAAPSESYDDDVSTNAAGSVNNNRTLITFGIVTASVFGACIVFACCRFRGKIQCRPGGRAWRKKWLKGAPGAKGNKVEPIGEASEAEITVKMAGEMSNVRSATSVAPLPSFLSSDIANADQISSSSSNSDKLERSGDSGSGGAPRAEGSSSYGGGGYKESGGGGAAPPAGSETLAPRSPQPTPMLAETPAPVDADGERYSANAAAYDYATAAAAAYAAPVRSTKGPYSTATPAATAAAYAYLAAALAPATAPASAPVSTAATAPASAAGSTEGTSSGGYAIDMAGDDIFAISDSDSENSSDSGSEISDSSSDSNTPAWKNACISYSTASPAATAAAYAYLAAAAAPVPTPESTPVPTPESTPVPTPDCTEDTSPGGYAIDVAGDDVCASSSMHDTTTENGMTFDISSESGDSSSGDCDSESGSESGSESSGDSGSESNGSSSEISDSSSDSDTPAWRDACISSLAYTAEPTELLSEHMPDPPVSADTSVAIDVADDEAGEAVHTSSSMYGITRENSMIFDISSESGDSCSSSDSGSGSSSEGSASDTVD
jgi:hypothetical protein